MASYVYVFGCLVLGITSVATPGLSAEQPDLDPAALDLLKQTVSSVANAKTYSFKVVVAHDRIATNDQLVTYVNYDAVTVSRPNRLRIDVDGEHNDVQFFYDGKTATLFNPEHKFYVTHPASSTIDDMLDAIEKQGVTFPINDLITTNSFNALVKGLQTAYVVGHVKINQKMFIHVVFTEASADWQLWVEPGDKPLPRAMTVIYKKQPGSPRTTMDFRDWNLNAVAPASTFAFVKPADAHEIDFLPPQRAGK
jgi:hypothetical protein